MPADPARGRRWADHRRTLEVIAWKYRTCLPLGDLPEELGSFQTAHKGLLRWAVDGTWQRIFGAVLSAADADDIGWTVSVDSTVCLAHQHAGGAGKRGGLPGRVRRPRARTLPWRPEHESPPGQRRPSPAPRPLRDSRPGRGCTRLRSRHWPESGSLGLSRKAQNATHGSPRGPGLLLPRDPRVSPPSRHPGSHPAAC